jgi:DNA-binding beta-propeller fold protein YncE
VVTTGGRAVWVGRRALNRAGLATVLRIDPATNAIVSEQPFGQEGVKNLAVGYGGVYISNARRPRISRLDVATGERVSRLVDAEPNGVAVGANSVWVANSLANTVSKLTPRLRNRQDIPVGRTPTGVAVGSKAVWVVNKLDSTVQRLDRKSGEPIGEPIKVGTNPFAIVAHGRTAWVTSLVPATVTRLQG